MQTVVLAAGRGTRMRPLTDRRPKPMLPVADRPLLAHTLDVAVDDGASRFVIVVGYRDESVRKYVGDTYAGVPVTYVTQDEQRGTADAVRLAAGSLEDGPFVVLNGDALFDPDGISRLYRTGPAVACYRVDDPTQYGVLDVEDGVVSGVVEKPTDPPSDLVNAGAYQFPSAARDWLDVPESERGEHEITDVLEHAADAVDVRAVPLDDWLDVGRPWELLAANEWKLATPNRSTGTGVDHPHADGPGDRNRATTDRSRETSDRSRAADSVTDRTESIDRTGSGSSMARLDVERNPIAGTVSEDATLRGPVVVEPGATIREGVTIEGPVLVRRGATVGPNAYLRGATLVGPDARVGHAVEIKNSLLCSGATVGHLSYVGDSILGRNVNLGAGTTVANLRHDDRPVELTVNGERVSTGRRKFGVVLGDEAKTAIDTALNAGVTLSTGATTTPGETVVRDR